MNKVSLADVRDIQDAYFNWLCGLVHADGLDHSFYRALDVLHSCIFHEIIKYDGNREGDGLKLRDEFALRQDFYTYEEIEDALYGRCTVLEMLIGLAKRIDEDVMYRPDESRMDRWFWEMFENLGLSDYPDEEWRDPMDEHSVERVVENFVERTFDYDGRGGLFPLREPKQDQRGVEIWYQMNSYLDEKYPI